MRDLRELDSRMRHIWLKVVRKEYENGRILEESNLHSTGYPVRNNAPLGFESQRLEFLTGFTHSLTFLASKTGIEIPESILDRLAEYTEFHLESRYPDEKKDFYKKCSEEFARKNLLKLKRSISG